MGFSFCLSEVSPPVTEHCATGVINVSIFLPTVGGLALQNFSEGKPFYTVLSHDLSKFGVTPPLCLCYPSLVFLLFLFVAGITFRINSSQNEAETGIPARNEVETGIPDWPGLINQFFLNRTGLHWCLCC